MPVELNFDEKYKTEADPWGIGDATHPRYDTYKALLLRHASGRGSLLDIGAGVGAFLSRFEGIFAELVGTDVSAEAVRRASLLHPSLEFLTASAVEMDAVPKLDRQWDGIVFSDVINYFTDQDKGRILRWIAAHLRDDGVALIAAWSPGGKYLSETELRATVKRHLVVVDEVTLETGHVALIAKRRRFLVAVTADYETWQPVPPGKRIDWNLDVFEPCRRLLDLCDSLGVRLTLFAEFGEYFWLERNEPDQARVMEDQWRDAIRRGHDVQLHLHPAWLPEANPQRTGETWWWNPERAKVDDYPGDLGELLERCRNRLEELLQPVLPSYHVRCFRAGAYQVQPSKRLADALRRAGIQADSSVWAGGYSTERGYDFRFAYSDRLPYFASPLDLQLLSVPAETDILEVPIWTPTPGERWSFDGRDPDLAGPLRRFFKAEIDEPGHMGQARRADKFRDVANRLAWGPLRPIWRVMARVAPRRWLHGLTTYGPMPSVEHEYFVMIGHTKGEHDFDHLRGQLASIKSDPRVEFATMSELAVSGRADATRCRRATAEEEAEFQVRREYGTVLGSERNDAPSRLLQRLVPLNSTHVLDLGCGAGDWSEVIAKSLPWAKVTGVDVGQDFVAQARQRHASERIEFVVGDFAKLPLSDAAFDCVYADNSLEHVFDLSSTLSEIRRVLAPGGLLVAAIPSDGRNPRRSVDNHTWKTVPHEVRLRLADAGFQVISIAEVDLLRRLQVRPYPPSNDRMIFVGARPRDGITDAQRLRRLVSWLYERLDPSQSHVGTDPRTVLSHGTAWCAGYALVLTELARQHGYRASQVTMQATHHERGLGSEGLETHEVVVVRTGATEYVADAMANRVFEHPLVELLRRPELATRRDDADARYASRRYDLYDTEYWYSRVVSHTVHDTGLSVDLETVAAHE